MNAPTILDFEASGFGKNSYPIEVGFAAENGSSWCSLIRPDASWQHWDDSAASLHHITRPVLLQHGKTPVEVADELNRFFSGQVIYTDGWLQDYVWMARLFDMAERVQRFRLEDLRLVLSPHQQSVWHDTKAAILAEMHFARHRASNDARVLQMTWIRTRDLAAEAMP